MAKQNKARLIKIISNARNKLSDIEDKEKEKQLKPLIGKCFKYRNSSGGDDWWWFYQKVLGLNNHTWLEVFNFQKSSYGRWEIHFNDTAISLLDGFTQISEEEFNQAWKECLTELSGYDLKANEGERKHAKRPKR